MEYGRTSFKEAILEGKGEEKVSNYPRRGNSSTFIIGERGDESLKPMVYTGINAMDRKHHRETWNFSSSLCLFLSYAPVSPIPRLVVAGGRRTVAAAIDFLGPFLARDVHSRLISRQWAIGSFYSVREVKKGGETGEKRGPLL